MSKKRFIDTPENIVLDEGMDVFQKLWERFEYAHPVVRAILLIVIMLLMFALAIVVHYVKQDRRALSDKALSLLDIGHQIDYVSAKVLAMADVLFAVV